MFDFKITFLAAAFLLPLIGCASDDDDDSGGSGSNGGNDVEIRFDEQDIEAAAASFTSSFGFVGVMFSQGPAAQGELPCLDSESEFDQDGYRITATLTDCEFQISNNKRIRYSGFYDVSASTSPDPEDVSGLIASCGAFIENLEGILAEAGEPEISFDADYNYDAQCLDDGQRSLLDDGRTVLVSFEESILISSSFTSNQNLFQGVENEMIGGTFHLVADTDNDGFPIGIYILEIDVDGVMRTVTFQLDGTEFAPFVIEQTNRSGIMNLETGEAQFDA